MNAARNTFVEGIDQDTSLVHYKNTKYWDAHNLRLFSPDGSSIGSLQNEKGNELSFKFPSCSTGFYIITGSDVDDTWSGTIGMVSNTITIPLMKIGNIGSYLASQSLPVLGTLTESLTAPSAGYAIGTQAKLAYRLNVIALYGTEFPAPPTQTRTGGSSGSSLTITPYTWSDQVPIGYANLRDRLIIFTTDKDNTSATPGPSPLSGITYGSIWSIRYSSNDTVVDLGTANYLTLSDHLIYHGPLNFSLANGIRAQGYHFSDRVGKVYWTDNYNQFRHLNIYDKTSVCLSDDQLGLLGNVKYSQPLVSRIIDGGAYKSGAVQYAYQLYNLYGAEAFISPTSHVYNLSSESLYRASSIEFGGTPIGDNTGKAVFVKIPEIDNRYDHIRLYSLFYGSFNDTPLVRVVTDSKVINLEDSEILDDGINFVDEISYQEFAAYDKLVFTCKDLAIKDKRMVVANINEERFDVDYDARTYRHSSGGSFLIDDYASPVIGSVNNWGLVDTYADCTYPDYSTHDTHYQTYKYKQDGRTIGGEGINVSYSFSTVPLPIASDATTKNNLSIHAKKWDQDWQTYFTDPTRFPSNPAENKFSSDTSYSSYASPINSAQLLGYMRGETYRFGVTFYNEKGQRAPVKWIGDIRFPESFEDGVSKDSVTSSVMRKIQSPNIPIIQGFIPGSGFTGWFGPFIFVNRPNTSTDYSLFISVTFGGVLHEKEFPIEKLTFTTELSDTRPSGGTRWFDLKAQINEWLLDEFGDNIHGDVTHNGETESGSIFLTSNVYDAALIGESHFTDGATTSFSIVNDYSSTTTSTFTSLDTTAISTSGDNGDMCIANILYPIFTLSNIPVDANGDPYPYEIVRVTREDYDKTIVAQGLILPTCEVVVGQSQGLDFGSLYPVTTLEGTMYSYNNETPNGTLGFIDNKLLNVISPEINFRDLELRSGDQLRLNGYFTFKNSVGEFNIIKTKFSGITNYNGDIVDIEDSGIIESYKSIEEPEVPTTIGDFSVRNIIMGRWSNVLSPFDLSVLSGRVCGAAGTSLFCAVDAQPTIPSAAQSSFGVGNITRDVPGQYGGSTYNARQSNVYHSCGAFVVPTSTTSNSHVFGGDTYIAYFDYLRSAWNDKYEMMQEIMFPVETSINLDYRIDRLLSKSNSSQYGHSRGQYSQEYAGDYSGLVGSSQKINYYQDGDMYLENPVYSKANSGIVLLPELPDTDFVRRKDAQIYISEEFNYDDKNDNLIKFLSENNTILNTSYGSINALVNYRDYLYVFQDRAVGVQFINERTILNDTTGSNLSIGSGDVAGRLQYITTSSGCQHNNSIVEADSGLYYFDAIGKSIYIVSGQDFNLTKTKGLARHFNSNINSNIADTQYLGYGIHGVYDENNSRILWTYLNGSTSYFTIGYSEVMKAFESFYDYTPCLYMKTFDNKVLSLNKLSAANYSAYLHDAGYMGEFYGVSSYSTLQLVVNEDALLNKQFPSIEFPLRVTDYNLIPGIGYDTYYNETITDITFSNNYQSTGVLTTIQNVAATTGQVRAEQHLRKWRIALPRVVSGGRQSRLADTYLNITMRYLNNNDKKISFEDIITYYTPCVL
jgi:hypothetical protein